MGNGLVRILYGDFVKRKGATALATLRCCWNKTGSAADSEDALAGNCAEDEDSCTRLLLSTTVFINELPRDLIEDILYSVGAIQQVRLKGVCKYWNAVIKSPILRKELCICMTERIISEVTPEDASDSVSKIVRPLMTCTTRSLTLKTSALAPADMSSVHALVRRLRPLLKRHCSAFDTLTLAGFHFQAYEIISVLRLLDRPTQRCRPIFLRCFVDLRFKFTFPCKYQVLVSLPTTSMAESWFDGLCGAINRDVLLHIGKPAKQHLADIQAVKDFALRWRFKRQAVLDILNSCEPTSKRVGAFGMDKVEWDSLNILSLTCIRSQMFLLGRACSSADGPQDFKVAICLADGSCSVKTTYTQGGKVYDVTEVMELDDGGTSGRHA